MCTTIILNNHGKQFDISVVTRIGWYRNVRYFWTSFETSSTDRGAITFTIIATVFVRAQAIFLPMLESGYIFVCNVWLQLTELKLWWCSTAWNASVPSAAEKWSWAVELAATMKSLIRDDDCALRTRFWCFSDIICCSWSGDAFRLATASCRLYR